MEQAPTLAKKPLFRLLSAQNIGAAAYLLILILFFWLYPAYVEGTKGACAWLLSAWNKENDYEHGGLVPVFAAYLFLHAWGTLPKRPLRGSLHGLWVILLGALLCMVAVRSQQPRVAWGALPFLLSGLIWCALGRRAALHCAFPCFFLWLAIPLPGFQQATVGMQLLAAEGSHWLAGVFGVETVLEGTNVSSASGQWDSFNIAGGCSGMRSLMALIMISAAWGYLAEGLSLWKRLLLGLSAIPISIVANAVRVASIFICAEYVSPAFAGQTWHDWSGLLFFFPASLVCLVLLHSLLAGEWLWQNRRRVVRRRHGEEGAAPACAADAAIAGTGTAPRPTEASNPAEMVVSSAFPAPTASISSGAAVASTAPTAEPATGPDSSAESAGRDATSACGAPLASGAKGVKGADGADAEATTNEAGVCASGAVSCAASGTGRPPRGWRGALRAFCPALLLGAAIVLIWLLPFDATIRESAISGQLPTGFELDGWYGTRTQESEEERAILAADTRFSKAIYQRINPITGELSPGAVQVSVIFSGNDMNSSIHRPERCLPAQGHLNLRSSKRELKLADGRSVAFTRLTSTTIRGEGEQKQRLCHVHYYVFVGNSHVCASHLQRTLLDIADRITRGEVQRWAYFQVGSSYLPDDPQGEQEADARLQGLIEELLPRLLKSEQLR